MGQEVYETLCGNLSIAIIIGDLKLHVSGQMCELHWDLYHHQSLQ
jgi:hypothetical protein